MAVLPVLSVPKSITELPYSKKSVEFRPFLVKEEKIMILADGSDNENQMKIAINQIIGNCTFGKIDSDHLCQVDLEHLLIKIRGESKGNKTELTFRCKNEIEKDGEKHTCDFLNDIEGDLSTIEVKGGKEDNLIDLGSGLGMKMRFPTISELYLIEKEDTGNNDVDSEFSRLILHIESIYDEDNVWETKNLEKTEIDDFIDSFSSSQLEKVQKWVDSSPYLELTVDYVCQKCGVTDKISIRGIDNFFG